MDWKLYLDQLERLPAEFTPWGSLRRTVLEALLEEVKGRPIRRSIETGTGKSTLLLSHLSDHHTVFSISSFGQMSQVSGSELLRVSNVQFIEGPTQKTLPTFKFEGPVDLAFLDGPHAYPFPDLEYFSVYPHLAPGAVLVVDDIHIPTINHLFQFLREDEMFELIRVVETTAFFRRTNAKVFDPYGDDWENQKFNQNHIPSFRGVPLFRFLKTWIWEHLPVRLKNRGRVVPLS